MPGITLDADFSNGELRFLIGGVAVIDRIFENNEHGLFAVAQWKVLGATFPVTTATNGKKLCNALRKLAPNDGAPVVPQIITLQSELTALEHEIARQEAAMNEVVYALYKLTAEEITLISAKS